MLSDRLLIYRARLRLTADVNFSVKNSKMTLKTHVTVKRTFKLHIQNASVIDPVREAFLFLSLHLQLTNLT
jgi:hypothetical protein